MKRAHSLRRQLVAWYVATAAVVALAVSLLGAVSAYEITLEHMRLDLNKGAQRVREIAAEFDAKHRLPVEFEPFLRARLAPQTYDLRVFARPENVKPLPAGAFAYGSFGTLRVFDTHMVLPGTTRRTDFRLMPPAGNWIAFTPGRPERQRMQGPMTEAPFSFLRDPLLRPERIAVGAGDVLLFPSPLAIRFALGRYFEWDAVFLAIVMLLAWFGANAVARKTLDPLERTTRALERFAQGDFTPEPVRTADRTELGDLARAYNGAVEQITRAFEERARGEAEMRQFVADAGHQLRTPLTVIMGHLSAFAAKAQTPRDGTVFASMLAQSRRMKGLIADLITLARLEHEDESAEVFEAATLVRQAVDPYAKSGETRVHFRSDGSGVRVRMRAEDLIGAVSALVDNALKYAPGGAVEVTVSGDAASCRICVDDSGPGMTEFEIAKAFDRFFRGESGATTEGTGLGLAIVKRSVERCGGTVTVRNRVPGGLSCCIVLPALADAAPEAASGG